MEEKIIVRAVEAGDTEAIVDIAKAQWRRIYDGYRAQIGEELYEIWYKNALAAKGDAVRKNAADTEHCIVTEIEGKVVGFAHYSIDFTPSGEKIGILGHNAVSEGYRGRGIAGRQYSEIFSKMKREGCVAVKVTTGLDDAHAPARRAYEKAGFERSLHEINYYKEL